MSNIPMTYEEHREFTIREIKRKTLYIEFEYTARAFRESLKFVHAAINVFVSMVNGSVAGGPSDYSGEYLRHKHRDKGKFIGTF